MLDSRGDGLWSETLQGKEKERVKRCGLILREKDAAGNSKSPAKGQRKKV